MNNNDLQRGDRIVYRDPRTNERSQGRIEEMDESGTITVRSEAEQRSERIGVDKVERKLN